MLRSKRKATKFMSKGNNKPDIELSERVKKATALLNEALSLLDVGRTSRINQSRI